MPPRDEWGLRHTMAATQMGVALALGILGRDLPGALFWVGIAGGAFFAYQLLKMHYASVEPSKRPKQERMVGYAMGIGLSTSLSVFALYAIAGYILARALYGHIRRVLRGAGRLRLVHHQTEVLERGLFWGAIPLAVLLAVGGGLLVGYGGPMVPGRTLFTVGAALGIAWLLLMHARWVAKRGTRARTAARRLDLSVLALLVILSFGLLGALDSIPISTFNIADKFPITVTLGHVGAILVPLGMLLSKWRIQPPKLLVKVWRTNRWDLAFFACSCIAGVATAVLMAGSEHPLEYVADTAAATRYLGFLVGALALAVHRARNPDADITPPGVSTSGDPPRLTPATN